MLKNVIARIVAISILFVLISCTNELENKNSTVNIIPQPVKVESKKGHFKINLETRIKIVNGTSQTIDVADYLNSIFKNVSDTDLKTESSDENITSKNTIILEIKNTEKKEEGYELLVSKNGIHIISSGDVGLFYGVQTLRQLLPLEVDEISGSNQKEWIVPLVEIQDEPRFGWRGLHLDVSRHFFSVDFIKKYIDHMARYKLNVFHWHLVDGPGWRIEIDAYPKLTEIGAWRVDKTNDDWNWRATEMGKPTDGRPAYGGYYSKKEIRDVVKYAKDRFIEVVPEIEMPGHSFAPLLAYPELGCVNNNIEVDGLRGKDVICVGNEFTFKFFKTVLDETMELFPSKLIHIGGDEVSKLAWNNCSRCQNLMKKEKLKNEKELQSYFMSKMANYVESKGREIIGWDEIMEGGLPKNAKVMSWRGMNGGIKSANLGHDVVMAPMAHSYFDLYQGDESLEPLAYGKLFLTDVYKFDPIPKDIEATKRHHILGGHACLWTENVQTPEKAEYMLFPRLFALAETVWTPKENLNFDLFIDRMEYNFERLDRAGINYAKSIYNVAVGQTPDSINKTIVIELNNEVNRGQIRYSLDGSDPTLNSELYTEPIKLSDKTTVKAATFREGKLAGKVVKKNIELK